MFCYLLFAAFPIAVSFVVNLHYENSIKSNDKAKRTFLFWCGIAMFLIIALRNKEVGSTDSENYFNNWVRMSNVSFKSVLPIAEETNMDIGYLVYVWISSHVFPNGQFAFVFSGLLFTIAVCRFIYKNSEDVLLSFEMFICLGLYSFMVQGLRQAMAMSICLFAIEFCKKRKFIPFVLVVFFASLFHQSAIVFLIVYFIYGFKINVRTGIVAAIASATLIVLSDPIATLGNRIFEREYEGEVETGGFVAVAIYLIILIVAIVFSGKRRKEKDYSFFFFMTMLGAIFYLMRYTGVQAAERISFYFLFGQLIVLPSVISCFDKHVAFIIKCVVMALSFMLFAYRLSGSGLVEYRFFWQ